MQIVAWIFCGCRAAVFRGPRRLLILGVAPPNPPAFLSPRICCANTRPGRSSDDDLINAANWIAFAAYRNVSDRLFAINHFPTLTHRCRMQSFRRSKVLLVDGLMVDKDESRIVRAILNHGDVPQNACMALLRVRGAFFRWGLTWSIVDNQ